VQFASTNKALSFLPQSEDADFAEQATEDQQVATTKQTADQQFDPAQFDSLFADSQTSFDMFGSPTPVDLDVAATDVADVTSDIPSVQTAAFEAPVEDTQLSTAPTDLMASDFGVAAAPVDTSPVYSMMNYGRDQGVQTAAYQPSNIMSDSDVGDIGLRSLVTTQQGGTSGTADDSGTASLTDRNLTETTKPDLEALTKGSATYSALTDQDPTKTIAGSILDDESEDVRGGIQSGALYSGAEDEFGASNTLTAKYLNKPTEETKAAEDVGITRGLGTGNDTYTYAEPRPTDQILKDTGTSADADRLDQFLSPLRTDKTTLPVSQEPARVTPTNLGDNMDEEYFDALSKEDADLGRAIFENMGGGDDNQVLLTPGGVDESFLDRLSPADRERYLAMQDPNYINPLEGLAPQDLGISQQNIDSFNQNFNPAGGFSSGWQTVGTDRIMINDDGTGTGLNENGGSYALSAEEVRSMINKGILNTAQSGYGAATRGMARPANTSTNRFTNSLLTPKTAAMFAGAAMGAAGGAKGIDPRGLRSIATGTGAERVQTGAKGTGGRGGVRYFEKKAAGGAVDGYAKGGGLGYLKSAHDGMEDKINATIDNKRPAKLSGGEFVIPADVVSHLGNGNSEAGAKQLYALMERVRKARTGTADQGKQINPKKYLPK
jgi:hypothetical protein